ncbi:MAG: hypothetical protein AAFO02_19995 [Bacteroidota bacterium]
MKRYLILLLLGLTVATTASAQEGSFVEVSAVRVSEAFINAYDEAKYQVGLFTIDKERALRPLKGNKLWVSPKTGKFRVAPAGFKGINELRVGSNFDVEPVPGGLMWCMCASANDDCKIFVSIADNALTYFCDGSCTCNKFFECDTPVMAYQTLGTLDWNPL